MWRRLLRRLAAFGEPHECPDAVVIAIDPHRPSVPYPTYLNAWDQVRPSDEGQAIIKTLHDNLVAELQARCPQNIGTAEGRAIWLAGHDARKKVLLDLTKHAMYGTRLLTTPKAQEPPQIIG